MAVRFWELNNYRKCWHRLWWCAYAQHQLQYTVTTMNGFKILLLPHKFCWDKVVILLPDSTFLEPKDLITDLGTMNQIPSLRRRSFPTESRILTAQELLMEYSLVVILLGCFIMVSDVVIKNGSPTWRNRRWIPLVINSAFDCFSFGRLYDWNL